MHPSQYDVKIQFNFITDPVHFISLSDKLLHRAAMGRFSSDLLLLISWRTSSSHRGTMGAIVLRWNADFLHFLGFFLSFCILDSGLMLFLVLWVFLRIWACLGHFTTNNNTKNTIEIPVITTPNLNCCLSSSNMLSDKIVRKIRKVVKFLSLLFISCFSNDLVWQHVTWGQATV